MGRRSDDHVSVSVSKPSVTPLKPGSNQMTATYNVNFMVGKQKWTLQRSIKDFNKLQYALKAEIKKVGVTPFPVEKKVNKNQASSIFQKKRLLLEQWLQKLVNTSVAKSPVFVQFIQRPGTSSTSDSEQAGATSPAPMSPSPSSPPPNRRRQSSAQSSAPDEDVTALKREIEELKSHKRRVTMDFESHMQDYEEMEATTKLLKEKNLKTLGELEKAKKHQQDIQDLARSKASKHHDSSKKLYEMEGTTNKLTAENKQLFKINNDLRKEVKAKQEMVERLESKIKTLEVQQRKVEREKTDLEISRLELRRKLEHQRLLKIDDDNIARVVAELETENGFLREAQTLNQLFVGEDDPILTAMATKIADLEQTVEQLLQEHKSSMGALIESHKEAILRVTRELTENVDVATQAEILVLRKELLLRESELKDLEIEKTRQNKEIKASVFKKFKEQLTGIRNESSRRMDELTLKVAQLSVDGGSSTEDKDEATHQEIFRLKRLAADQEAVAKKMRLERDSIEDQYETELSYLHQENESLQELALSLKSGDTAMMQMMKKQIAELNEDMSMKTMQVEEERKLREQDKINAETEYKTLQIDFDDLSQSATKKVEKLKMELQKKENDLLHLQSDGLHGVEDMEELHRKHQALKSELSEMKRQSFSSSRSSFLNTTIQGIQRQNDQLRDQVSYLRSSKISLINNLAVEMDNMRQEIRYQNRGRKGDPPRYEKAPPPAETNGHGKRNTIDLTIGASEKDSRFESVYNFEVELNKTQPPSIQDL